MKKVLALFFVLLTSCQIVMFNFFDYVFYRFFTYCVQKKAEDAFLRSVLYVFFSALCLLFFIVDELVCLLIKESYPKILTIVLFIICFVRYKNKKKREKIIERFNGAVLNKWLPIWMMPIITMCLLIFGVYLKYIFLKLGLNNPT